MAGRALVRSVRTLKYDDDFCWLGFMGQQTGQFHIAPISKVYHCPGRRDPRGTLVRLYDIQSVAVEEERVAAEQFGQFRSQRMIIRDHLGFELVQSLFDLRGI